VLSQILSQNPHIFPVIQNEAALRGSEEESLIDFMANRMMIVLSSPEEIIIKEGDTLESNHSSNINTL